MIMTTPFCPYGPAILEQTRRAAEKHAQIPVKLTLGMEMWEPSMMEGDLRVGLVLSNGRPFGLRPIRRVFFGDNDGQP